MTCNAQLARYSLVVRRVKTVTHCQNAGTNIFRVACLQSVVHGRRMAECLRSLLVLPERCLPAHLHPHQEGSQEGTYLALDCPP